MHMANTKPLKDRKINIDITPRCAPVAEDNLMKFNTCFNPSELRVLASIYNKTTDASRKIKKQHFNNPSILLRELNARFKESCRDGDDRCWIENNMFKDDFDLYQTLKSKFKPDMNPEWANDIHKWLNNRDIDKAMLPYEEKYKNFKFFKALPSDGIEEGVCTSYNTCNFSLSKLLGSGKSQLGFVFNLDEHDEPGSHWVALYINTDANSKKFGVTYYDSMGNNKKSKPPRKILKFIYQVRKQASDMFTAQEMERFLGRYNVQQHQFKNTECGMYSILFLIACIQYQEKDIDEILNFDIQKYSDDEVVKYRHKLYNMPSTMSS